MKLFEINKNLKERILKNLPENYNNLEKSILIYKRLCETLQYSFDYYLDNFNPNINEYFQDINNLKKVDGEKNKDVVCFTFNAILAQLLLDAKVVQDVEIDFDEFNNKLVRFHFPLGVKIDNKKYELDSTLGVLDWNDLTLSKYAGHIINGWECSKFNNDDNSREELKAAIQKVCMENQTLESKLEKYVKIKKLDETFLNVPINKRVETFLDLAKKADYSIFGFNNLIKYKHICFSYREIEGIYKTSGISVDQYIDLLFAKEMDSDELKAFLFFNPKGYTNEKDYENFEYLKIYLLSLKDKSIKPLTKDECEKLFREHYFVEHNGGSLSPKMINNGIAKIVNEYDGEFPIYDHEMNPINITRRYRKHIKTDKIEELPLEIEYDK